MKVISCTLLLFFYLCASYNSGAQNWLWGRGNTKVGMDGWAVATDPSGNVFGGGIAFTPGIISFGTYTLSVTGTYPCVVVKYDPSGNVLWARAVLGGSQALVNLTTDASGNLYLLGGLDSGSAMAGGITLNNASGNRKYFIVKYDPAGNVLWAKTDGEMQSYFASTATSYVLGPGGLVCDAAGNLYVTANFHSPSVTIGSTTLTNTDPTGTTDDILVAKYDPSGNLIWAKNYGGSKNDDAYGITVTPAGDIYIDGTFNSTSVSFGPSVINYTSSLANGNAFVARLNASGMPTWAAASGGTSGESAVGIAADGANNVYITGGFYGASLRFPGTSITNPTPSVSALYLIKLNSSNTADWSKIITSTGGSDSIYWKGTWGYSISMSPCGVIWVSGVMNGPVSIDGNILDTPAHKTDPIFIAGYTTTGTYVGSAALQSGGDDQNGIACDIAGNVYMCSDYWGYSFIGSVLSTDYFRVGNDILPKDSAATELLFVAKYPSQNSGGCGCGGNIFVPNTFTPNGDNKNDVFYPYSATSTELIKSFRIYDRWGELLFERNNIFPGDASNGWDGSYKNASPRSEAFVWVLDIACEDGKTKHQKGSITVIR